MIIPTPVLRYASVNTTRLVGYRAGYPFSARAVSAIDDFHPDILHTHCPVASTLLARTAREGTGAPVVFTYHTKFDIDIRTALKGELLQNQLITAMVRNIEACDEVWTVSRGAGENLRSLGFRGEYRVMGKRCGFPPRPRDGGGNRRHYPAPSPAAGSPRFPLYRPHALV